MRLAWLTDLHLDHCAPAGRAKLLADVKSAQPDAVLIGGDIANSATLCRELNALADDLRRPIYFVLGNHDYYGASLGRVWHLVQELCARREDLHWLPAEGVVPLGRRTALIGHGGWGDARAGDFLRSSVVLNDYLLIEDLRSPALRSVTRSGHRPLREDVIGVWLQQQLQKLGDAAAAHLSRVLPLALDSFSHVLVLMHVPPFREACWHEGRTSDDDWAPHFVCQAAGDVLIDSMRRRPDKRMTVLCGHTHSPGEAWILDNLRVLTGGAVYGEPQLQQVVELD